MVTTGSTNAYVANNYCKLVTYNEIFCNFYCVTCTFVFLFDVDLRILGYCYQYPKAKSCSTSF